MEKIGPIDGDAEVITADSMFMGKTLYPQNVEQQPNSNHDSIILRQAIEEPRNSPVQFVRTSVYDPPSLQLGYTDAVALNEGTSIPDYVQRAKEENLAYLQNPIPQHQADFANLVSSIVPDNDLTSPTNVKFPNDPIPVPAYEQFVNIEVPVEPVEPAAPKMVPRSVGTPITFKEYCENEWHGFTNRAKTVRDVSCTFKRKLIFHNS